jgi:hypothetical protein
VRAALKKIKMIRDYRLLPVVFLAAIVFAIDGFGQSYPCLAKDVKTTDVVSARPVSLNGDEAVVKKTTVKQTLKALKARCSKNRLVDGKGKQIKFYRLIGCWGNPPAGYGEILANQQKEIAELKKKYTVIEMTCNPGGVPIP